MGMNTPWGYAQQQSTIAAGIIIVSTAGHGGIKLSDDRNAVVHEAWRNSNGWYEEDCEANIVAVTFPAEFAAFNPNWLDADAHESARHWFPDQYETVFGVTLTGADSYLRSEQLFYKAHANDWVVTAAWGSWKDGVPEGMVGVAATIGGKHGGDDAYFLVPDDEYQARNGRFVVDTARHIKVPGIIVDPYLEPATDEAA